MIEPVRPVRVEFVTERIARWWSAIPPVPTAMILVAMFALPPLLGWYLAHGLMYVKGWTQWLVFAALFMVALVPIVVRWPVISTFGLYALLTTSFDAFPLLPGGGTLSKPAGALAGAALLAAGLVERRLSRPPTMALWWAAFMLWAVLSAAWALDSEVALKKLPSALSFFVLYLAAVCFRPSRREFLGVCVLTVLGGVLAAGLAYFFGLQEQETDRVVRGSLALNDVQSNSNLLGRVLLLPLILAIAGFLAGPRMLHRVFAIGCVAFIGLGIFISMSRGAVVSMAAALLVLLYRTGARWHAVAVMIVLLMGTMLMPGIYTRFDAVISGEDTGSGRLEIWQTGLQMVERSGFFGVGLTNYSVLHGMYVPGHHSAAHNVFLSTLVDHGVPGLAMMLAAILSGLLAVSRARSAGRDSIALSALEAACIGTLVSNVFADYIWTKTFWLVWILLFWAIPSGKRSGETSQDVITPRDALLSR
jgi:O-antigen ligase